MYPQQSSYTYPPFILSATYNPNPIKKMNMNIGATRSIANKDNDNTKQIKNEVMPAFT